LRRANKTFSGLLRSRKVLYLIALVAAFPSLWATNHLTQVGSPQYTNPPRPVGLNAGLYFRNVTADEYGMVAEVDAVFTASTQPPSEDMTLIYYDSSSVERTTNITLGSSTRLNLRFYGDPANFPFDTYRSDLICKFPSSSGEVWTTISISPRLTVTPVIESKWWVLPSVEGSSYYLFVARNPFSTFLRFGWLQLFIFLLPLSLLISHKKLSERVLPIISILVGGETLVISLQQERPPVVTQQDVLHLWFVVGGLLLVLYCVLSNRLPSEETNTRVKVFLCFLPFPLFGTVFAFEQAFIQVPYSQFGADVWISIVNMGQTLCLVVLCATIAFIWRTPSYISTLYERLSPVILGVLVAAASLPLIFILYGLKGANPFEPVAIAIYVTLVVLSLLAKVKLQLGRFGLPMMAACNLMYPTVLNYEYLRENVPPSYSPLVSVAKQTVAPGIYALWGPHDLISAVFAVVLVFLVLLPTLIPFALIEEVQYWRKLCSAPRRVGRRGRVWISSYKHHDFLPSQAQREDCDSR